MIDDALKKLLAVDHNGQASLAFLRVEAWTSDVTRLLSNLVAQDCVLQQSVLQFSRNPVTFE